jgi:polyvinyl alcohol dehydrogenase (cytochrome)
MEPKSQSAGKRMIPPGGSAQNVVLRQRRRSLLSALGILVLCAFSTMALVDCSRKAAPVPEGSVVFGTHCAMCHAANSSTRAPQLESLRQMSKGSILAALETGEMRAQGAKITKAERAAVANYLADPKTSTRLSGYCPAYIDPPPTGPKWDGWSLDGANNRFQTASAAGLTRDQVPNLNLKWAFGFPGASATFSQPTVFAGKLYVGSEDGTVYSIDAKTGCIYWTFQATATVKTAISVSPDGNLAYFGDTNGNVYALHVPNGSQAWKARPDEHPQARITGSPVLNGGRLYVPMSSGEEGAAGEPTYQCCTFRGSVVALDAATGRQIWKAHTIRDIPKSMGRNAAGAEKWGPSGAAVWSSPTLDVKRHAIYVATGNNYSDPPTDTSDAIIAFNLETGKMLWSHQFTADDIWNIACVSPTKQNCPDKPGGDFDFGAPPLLRSLPGGHDVLLLAQKSGVVYALDPDHSGKILWAKRVGKGGPLGGIEWGGAADQRRAYFPVSDWDPDKAEVGGGLFALDLRTGSRVWYAAPDKPACLGQVGCSAAQMAPPSEIPGVVFEGSLDGHLRAYDARSGAVIWDFNAAQPFHTINGVKAHGGSFNGAGPDITGGMVYVNAGYTNELDGNVLLAFSADNR